MDLNFAINLISKKIYVYLDSFFLYNFVRPKTSDNNHFKKITNLTLCTRQSPEGSSIYNDLILKQTNFINDPKLRSICCRQVLEFDTLPLCFAIVSQSFILFFKLKLLFLYSYDIWFHLIYFLHACFFIFYQFI